MKAGRGTQETVDHAVSGLLLLLLLTYIYTSTSLRGARVRRYVFILALYLVVSYSLLLARGLCSCYWIPARVLLNWFTLCLTL